MVQVAANMAQAASIAFPPLWKVMAPAVAARGLPVMAIQCRPCSTGFWVGNLARPVGAACMGFSGTAGVAGAGWIVCACRFKVTQSTTNVKVVLMVLKINEG